MLSILVHQVGYSWSFAIELSYGDCGRICLSVAFHCFYISNVSDIFV